VRGSICKAAVTQPVTRTSAAVTAPRHFCSCPSAPCCNRTRYYGSCHRTTCFNSSHRTLLDAAAATGHVVASSLQGETPCSCYYGGLVLFQQLSPGRKPGAAAATWSDVRGPEIPRRRGPRTGNGPNRISLPAAWAHLRLRDLDCPVGKVSRIHYPAVNSVSISLVCVIRCPMLWCLPNCSPSVRSPSWFPLPCCVSCCPGGGWDCFQYLVSDVKCKPPWSLLLCPLTYCPDFQRPQLWCPLFSVSAALVSYLLFTGRSADAKNPLFHRPLPWCPPRWCPLRWSPHKPHRPQAAGTVLRRNISKNRCRCHWWTDMWGGDSLYDVCWVKTCHYRGQGGGGIYGANHRAWVTLK
jgi:hypothetical protein